MRQQIKKLSAVSYQQSAFLKTSSILLCVVGLVLFTVTGSSFAKEEVWEEANQAYESENYLRAINSYSTLLEKNKQSPALHFNLANAYINVGETARAIYHYELAIQIDPRVVQNFLTFWMPLDLF